MALRHLTDEEIQDFLDGNLSPQNALSIQTHLGSCPACQQTLKQYQGLYAGLKSDQGFVLSPDFAKSVISKLPAEAKAKSILDYAKTFLSVLGALFVVGVTLHFVGLRQLGRAWSHAFLPQYELSSTIIASIKSVLIGLNGNVGLLILALLALSIIAGLDHFVLQPKYRRISW
jgi:predicted anti-sigma-YlaC factor YlaD